MSYIANARARRVAAPTIPDFRRTSTIIFAQKNVRLIIKRARVNPTSATRTTATVPTTTTTTARLAMTSRKMPTPSTITIRGDEDYNQEEDEVHDEVEEEVK